MSRQIIIVRTEKGALYGNYIRKEINLLGIKSRLCTSKELTGYVKRRGIQNGDTILHFRTAGPKINQIARNCAKRGYRVINTPEALEISSNKLLTVSHLASQGIRVSRSAEFPKSVCREELETQWSDSRFVIKPTVGIGQGAYCFRSHGKDPDLAKKIRNVPGENLLFQEYVDYQRIFRVTVVDGVAMGKAVFMDEPTKLRWKVSVCLNDKMKHVDSPDPRLLDYALDVAKACGLEIGFIDVFQSSDGYILSEVNTACSLIQHERMSGFNISREIAKYLVRQI